MDKTEKSMDSLVAQQSFFNLIKGKSTCFLVKFLPRLHRPWWSIVFGFELIIIKGTLNYDSIRMLKFNTLFNMKLSSSGNLSCTHFTDSSQSPDEGRSLAKHSLDTIMVSFLHVLHWEKKKRREKVVRLICLKWETKSFLSSVFIPIS